MSQVSLRSIRNVATVCMLTGLVACTAPMGDDAPSSLGSFAGPEDQADHGNRLVRMGDDAMRSGDFAAAAAIYERAAAARPGDGVPLDRLGDAFLRMNEPQKALEAYRAALRIDPMEPRASRGYGLALMRLGRPDAALAQIEPVLAGNRDDTRLWNAAGVAYDMTGRQEDAQRIYRSVLERSPGDVAAANNLALSLLLSGRSEEAIDLLRPLAEDARGSGRSRQNLALAYGIEGNFDAARRLLSLDLGDRDVEANIALLRAMQGGDPAATARVLLNAPQAAAQTSVFDSMQTGSIDAPAGVAATEAPRPDLRKQAVHHIKTNPRDPVGASKPQPTAQASAQEKPAQPASSAQQAAKSGTGAGATGAPVLVEDAAVPVALAQPSSAAPRRAEDEGSAKVVNDQVDPSPSGQAAATQGALQDDAARGAVEASETASVAPVPAATPMSVAAAMPIAAPVSVTASVEAEDGDSSGAAARGGQAADAARRPGGRQRLDGTGLASGAPAVNDGDVNDGDVNDGDANGEKDPASPAIVSSALDEAAREEPVSAPSPASGPEPLRPPSSPVGDVEPGGAVSRVGVVAIANTEMAVGNIPVGDWLVDLGSFPTDRMAAQAWRQLRRSNPALLGFANRMGGVGDGRTPLLVGPFGSEAAARETCSGIIGAAECTPVKM